MSHYFKNDENLKSNKKLINVNFENKNISLYTDNGVFSKEHFDYGSRLLIKNFISEDKEGKVLDLGCGYGVIGILLSQNKNLFIDMVDVNLRALELTKDNLKLNNVDWQLKDGFRITEENSIPLIKMAAFDVSNKIMTALSGNGLTALIGNWVRSRAKGIIEGFDYGICGEIDKIHIEALNKVLDDGFIPIFPCIGWSASGKPYNISSIKLACETAIKLNADKLFFLTPDCSITSSEFNISSEMPLSPEGCVPALNLEELDKFLLDNKDNSSPVINLLKNGLETCKKGVSRVHILNGQIDGTLPCEIFSDLGSGTMIYKSNYGGIRKMQIDDISSVLTLMRPFIEKGILLNRTEQDLQDTFSDFIVYELDGAIRACASLHLYDDLQGEIAAIAVDKNCSHMGIGPKLVSYLIEEAKKESAKSVFVLTTQTSDWFEKLGFIPDDIETLPEKRKALWTKKRNSKLLRLNLS